ncbi:fumarylacetoacetate hydrolase family protein [Streptomyces althioticus]|uniref:fumarylacetoacetate hydrolase family protein n=1 Tax=Streptomyces althioticus TaxID=83380 RepID=UPI0037B2EFA9
MTHVRRRFAAPGHIVTETSLDGATWAPTENALGYASPFSQEWELEQLRRLRVADGDVVLPFRPLSVRDFTISEKHNIDGAKGYARRFMPRLATVARGIETVTRRPVKALRPNKLWYEKPIYYLNNTVTFVPSGTPVAFPSYTKALDYELQLAFVINQPLLDATPQEAEKAIGAFVVMCDFSARDVQIPEMQSGTGPQKGKHFLNSMSATAVTADEVIGSWRDLKGTVTVNGEVVARPFTSDAHYGLGELLAHASQSEQLVSGEMFSIGCLTYGSGMEMNHWIAPGDTIRLDLPGIGTIEHPII